MRKRTVREKIEFYDGEWHEVNNPNESTQHELGFLYEETKDYIIESFIWYYICDDESILKKFKYWTTDRLTLKNPQINPFKNRNRYFFDERFISYKFAKDFVFKWNEDARLFMSTISTKPNEEILTKYYKAQRENDDDYDNILDLIF